MAETKAKYEGENIDFADYSSAENEGEFKGKLVGRFWGRKGNLVLSSIWKTQVRSLQVPGKRATISDSRTQRSAKPLR